VAREVERTDDGRWIVVDGRRWRTADPALPDDVRARLLHHLGVARSAVRMARGDDDALTTARARVQRAKEKDLPAPHRSRARGGPLQGGRPVGG
jgi:hypothetical protein